MRGEVVILWRREERDLWGKTLFVQTDVSTTALEHRQDWPGQVDQHGLKIQDFSAGFNQNMSVSAI